MRHFFVRDSAEFPVACIATEKDATKIMYAISICNPLDRNNFSPKRAIHIAEERLKKYMNGGYDNTQNKQEGVPDFEGSKVGILPYTEGENVKMSLLVFLGNDPDLPKRFRKATEERMEIMRVQAAQRAQAAKQVEGGTPATP